MVRSLPSRRYNPVLRAWVAPYTKETWAAMRMLGFPLDGLTEPTASGYRIAYQDGLLEIRVPFSAENVQSMHRMPDHRMWDPKRGVWRAKATRRNILYLEQVFPTLQWEETADTIRRQYAEKEAAKRAGLTAAKAASLEELEATADDYKHGGPVPFDWQRKCFLISRDMPAYAIFAEQRTGKTKVAVDTATRLYVRGKVRQALVICPNTVKTVWSAEGVPEHTPDYVEWTAAVWKATPKRADRVALETVFNVEDGRLRWLVMNVESLSTKRGATAALKFVKQAPTAVFIDESTRIKTPRSARSLAVRALRNHAAYRRILTGTPATESPLDLWAQFEFLDPDILGGGSYYGYRNRYAIMGGWNGKVVLGYQHLDELAARIAPYSYRVTRDECFDIPPKGYQKLVVDLQSEQRRLYNEMRDRMRAELDGKKVTAHMVVVQMLRLSQIAGGFLPIMDGDDWEKRGTTAIPGGNPKIEAVLELADDVTGKVVIWARFRSEIAATVRALKAKYGDLAVVEMHGDVKEDERFAARTAFQDPASKVRFFVGQTETGGLGLNLSQARTIVYLSNGFSLESRLQSEDRASSAEQKHSVAIVDVIARDTVDEGVVKALRAKMDVSRTITGDNWKEWL